MGKSKRKKYIDITKECFDESEVDFKASLASNVSIRSRSGGTFPRFSGNEEGYSSASSKSLGVEKSYLTKGVGAATHPLSGSTNLNRPDLLASAAIGSKQRGLGTTLLDLPKRIIFADDEEDENQVIVEEDDEHSVSLGENDSRSEGSSANSAESDADSLNTDFPVLGLKTPSLTKPAVTTKQQLDPKPQWSSLFAYNRKLGCGLKLRKIDGLLGQKRLKMTKEDEISPSNSWDFSLIGYIAGKTIGKGSIIRYCNSWNVNYKIFFDVCGWIGIKFENDIDRMHVLQLGPHTIYSRPFILKPMPRYFAFEDEEIRNVPVWIKLPKLPIVYWNDFALSRVASLIGTPLQTDIITEKGNGFSFALALVEIDVALPLVHEIELELPNGKILMQKIEYEYVPRYCGLCKTIGHAEPNCGGYAAALQGSRYQGKQLPNYVKTAVNSAGTGDGFQSRKEAIKGAANQSLQQQKLGLTGATKAGVQATPVATFVAAKQRLQQQAQAKLAAPKAVTGAENLATYKAVLGSGPLQQKAPKVVHVASPNELEQENNVEVEAVGGFTPTRPNFNVGGTSKKPGSKRVGKEVPNIEVEDMGNEMVGDEVPNIEMEDLGNEDNKKKKKSKTSKTKSKIKDGTKGKATLVGT